MSGMKAPDRIWLLPYDGEQRSWCDDPDPSGLGYGGEADGYVRHDLYDATIKQRDELQAEVKKLREALQPFADEAAAWENFSSEEPLVEGFDGYSGQITVADCRHALAALQRKEGNG